MSQPQPAGDATLARDIAVSASGLLRDFSSAGALGWADVHPAQQLAHLFGEGDARVQLALALVVRAMRSGSVCLEFDRITDLAYGDEPLVDLPAEWWPDPAEWLDALRRSPAVTVGDDRTGDRPLRLVDGRLYLERHWQDQESVRRDLVARLAGAPDQPGPPPGPDGAQAAAVQLAIDSPVSIIAGGPGTGKTWTIRRVIERLQAEHPGLLVGLAAPTGKAAAQMTRSLDRGDLTATTIHALLGWKPGPRNRFRHDATNPLPHDVVVVDEMSMVSMVMMARLLAALKPTARLVLVGDPDQLPSVDAGSLLADITRAPASRGVVTELTLNHRFAGDVQLLATAIRHADADAALDVLSGEGDVRLVDPAAGAPHVRARAVPPTARMVDAALAGDAAAALTALDEHRVLCGHRRGPYGVQHWGRLLQAWFAEDVPGFSAEGEFPIGRPLMMTRNAREFDLNNGDTGVVVAAASGVTAWFGSPDRPRPHPPFLLDGLQSVYAMTVHKSQGSQFRDVSVILPPVGSPLLTRELLYTAVTRAERSVLLVGDAEAVRQAIANPVRRTSGLSERLRSG